MPRFPTPEISSIVLPLAVLSCAGASAPAASPSGQAGAADEETAVAQAMVNRFVDSWNRADGVAYGEGYWPDAELVDPTGGIANGREAIAGSHVDLWRTVFKGSQMKATVRRIRRLGASHIIVDLDLELTGFHEPHGGKDVGSVVKAHLKHVMEKRGGDWKIVAAQNTFFK